MVVGLLTIRLWDATILSEGQYQRKVGIGKNTDLQHLQQQRNVGIGKTTDFAVMETVANMLMQKYRDQHQPIRLEPDVPNRTLDMSDPSTEVLQADAMKNRSLSVLTLVRRRGSERQF